MADNKEITLLVSSCDLYEDAWNPFFRLLQENWKNCPKSIYLITESKNYEDSFFDIQCIHCSSDKWSDRMIYALEQIDSEYIWFFLEDFFLEDKVDEKIVLSAIDAIKRNEQVGVIKFIPRIKENWYDKNRTENEYFSPVPRKFSSRSNLMLSLYKKEYFRKLLRKKETPWDFEKFGTYRSRRYSEEIWVQNNKTELAFPYNYEIKFGYGITGKKWLKNNKLLFERYGVQVDFENLGWYEEVKEEKLVGMGRSKKEKLLMPFKDPKLFLKILSIQLKPKIYCITHIRNYF